MSVRTSLNSAGYLPMGEDCQTLIKRVCEKLRPRSVLDVGCGPGRSMKDFVLNGVEDCVGIDGSIELLGLCQDDNVRRNMILVNLEKSPCVLGRKFDLVWSYEVAEHIENEENFLLTLTENAGKHIIMTAAPPSQGGTHHVNCKETSYWIRKIEDLGFCHLPDLVEEFRRGGWEEVRYMAVSGMVFIRLPQPAPAINHQLRKDIKIAAHYCCYKDKRATYEALYSFRQFYPDAPIHLISDGGDNFQDMAEHFGCDYTHGQQRSGDGRTTKFNDVDGAMLWLNRLKHTCQRYVNVDWIVILEDDVKTCSRIKWEPPSPMSGICTMEFSPRFRAYIHRKYPKLNIHKYSGSGGTIIHRETFLKCMENVFDFKEMEDLDNRIVYHSDALLTALFLYNGYENGPWLDVSELAYGRGVPGAAFDHQFKKHYGKRWDDSYLKTGVPAPKVRKRGDPLRFHLLGTAHIPTRREYVACAYTYKIIRLAEMLKNSGHEVLFYGSELSKVRCDEFIPVCSEEVRLKEYGNYDWRKSSNFKCNPNDCVHAEFNSNAIKEIKRRKEDGDFLLCTMGNYHKPIADAVGGEFIVESGVGYEGIFAKYRVFESYAWMHYIYGKYGINDGHIYDAVIPNYYDKDEFGIAKEKPNTPYLLHISRMIPRKGIRTSIEVAKAARIKLIIAGQGDVKPFLGKGEEEFVEFVGVIEGEQKLKLISEALALIMPTVYIGPFEGVNAEAQLCGVPVLSTDWGCFAETVEHGKTGFRCRTLRDYINAIDCICKGELSPEYIRNRAISLWDMQSVSKLYNEYFYRLLDLNGAGWYAL